MSKFRFSVLISVYNKENPDFLEESLNSLLKQTILPTQIVLVKDGPLTPELDNVIQSFSIKYEPIKIITLPINNGLGNALNIGLQACDYDLIARMDSDDISHPSRFHDQLEIFAKYQNIDVVGAWIEEFEGTISNVLSVKKLPEQTEDIFNYARRRCPINHPVVMFRKSAVLAAGGYQHFPLFEDYFLWARMLKSGFKFYNIQRSLLYFRISSDVFKRRGGFKYAMTEIKLQKLFLSIGFINKWIFINNITIRFIMRIIPNSFRGWIYRHILR